MCVCHSYGHRARRASFKQRPHKSAASWLDRGGVHMLIPAMRRLDRNESQNRGTHKDQCNIDGSKYASEKRVRYTEHRAKRCQNPHHGYVWRCDILPTSYEWLLHIFTILRILCMRHLHAFAAWRLVGEHMTYARCGSMSSKHKRLKASRGPYSAQSHSYGINHAKIIREK